MTIEKINRLWERHVHQEGSQEIHHFLTDDRNEEKHNSNCERYKPRIIIGFKTVVQSTALYAVHFVRK